MSKKKTPSLFIVTFQDGKRLLQLHCRQFGFSEFHGLYELGEIVFSESRILLHEEEALKSEFKDVKRILLPFTALLRVDEMKAGYRAFDGPRVLSENGVERSNGPVVVNLKNHHSGDSSD